MIYTYIQQTVYLSAMYVIKSISSTVGHVLAFTILANQIRSSKANSLYFFIEQTKPQNYLSEHSYFR